MGKAIVIDGLQVTNPLCTVTFSGTPAENALAAYLAANTSINTTEEEALMAFVEGLINANLWGKMKYFYPLLGNNVTDSVLEVVSPSTEDLFTSVGTTGLSVDSRKLSALNRGQSEVTLGTRASSLDLSKIGIITAAINSRGGMKGSEFWINANSSKRVSLFTSTGTYRYPNFHYDATTIGHGDTSPIYTEGGVEVFGTIDNGTCYLYDGITQLATESVSATTGTLNRSYGLLYNTNQTNSYEYDFFAITEGMTTADWLVFHQLLMTFLQAVGKRTA